MVLENCHFDVRFLKDAQHVWDLDFVACQSTGFLSIILFQFVESHKSILKDKRKNVTIHRNGYEIQ